jgi:hypothetical protein
MPPCGRAGLGPKIKGAEEIKKATCLPTMAIAYLPFPEVFEIFLLSRTEKQP